VLHISLLTLEILLLTVSFHLYPRKLTFATLQGLRLIKGVNNRVSCRSLFGDFKILTVTSLYIFEILCFTKRIRSIRLDIPTFISITQKGHKIYMSNHATLLVAKKV
jgi:hypothetical protein